jgi:DNA-binding NtrC family response regulator
VKERNVADHNGILIIDDNVDLANNMQEILDMNDYSADIAVDGKQALEMCGKTAYKLAIVDLRLPDIRGDQLIPRLRSIRPDLRSIVLSGYSFFDGCDTFVGSNGVVACETKPIKIAKLVELVSKFMSGD